MFALSRGELAMVLFIFAIIWCSGVLPRFGERMGVRLSKQRSKQGQRDRG
ncbi:MAG: hypothetical protein ACLP1X_29875 [Polyangiaceae bacterium]|jgi:hypothetical protein